MRRVFLAGGTGYMGQRLAKHLSSRSHQVRVLARPGSEKKVNSPCEAVVGDPLRPETFALKVAPCDTWVHLVGVPHPNPRKAELFQSIDLRSVELAVPVALAAGVQHFVYVSVAHPAPVMKAYTEVRKRCEEIIIESGMNATLLRPWYVLGPGHRWPYLLKPIYALLEKVPSTSESAKRLGLVTISQMVAALTRAVEEPSCGIRIFDVPEIRRSGPAD